MQYTISEYNQFFDLILKVMDEPDFKHKIVGIIQDYQKRYKDERFSTSEGWDTE